MQLVKLFVVFVLMSASMNTFAAERPNVILFIADDVSWNDYGCYGNDSVRTPNIDALATGGMRFTQAYLTASSCSPSRSSIMTGRYPHNNGKAAELHQPIDWHLPWFATMLRESGYYTALVGKHHMSSTKPPKVKEALAKPFDLVDAGRSKTNHGGHATWVQTVENRPKDKPFFFWFAAYDAHRAWEADREWDTENYGPMHDPASVIVPPYLSDDLETRQDLASYYNEVCRFDYYIGQVVATLKKQDQLDNTLLFVLADNGRPFPRAKTRLHDSGMRTALVAHWPKTIKHAGSVSHSLVSVIDLAPTILATANLKPAETMQGVSMLPVLSDPSASVRKYAFSEHNWHDYEAHGRSIRDSEFLLIKNSRPYLPLQGPADSVRSPSHKRLLALRDAKKLSNAQADVFAAPRPTVSLFRTDSDPLQLQNLANDPKHAKTKARLLALLEQWIDETGDSVPKQISQDSFDRETGKALKKKNYRQTTPGEDRGATKINASGPR